jgi:hypothetical protein
MGRSRLGGALAAFLCAVAVAVAGCDRAGSSGSGGCAGTCGFTDHKYFSEYYCGGCGGWIGLSWRVMDHCLAACRSAAAWGCEAGGCEPGCAPDHGTGAWLPCDAASNGEVTESGCFLAGSGLNGETVACECR